MAARQSAAPAVPSADKAYDPEIQDMASYIHQYNVDSDLAVSFLSSFMKFLISGTFLNCENLKLICDCLH
jgi:hypothetical protein